MQIKDSLVIQESNSNLEWDNFILQSINKNFYSLSDCLDIEKDIKKFFVYKNKEKVASFCVLEKNKNLIDSKYLLYTPINYKTLFNSKSSSINVFNFLINEKIFNFLINNYNDINISFDLYTSDIRPFSWFGYPDYKKKFLLGVNYTLISNIKDLNYSNYIDKEIYTNSSETNRREIRNSLKKNYKFKDNFSKEIFFALKKKSYSIHNAKMDIDYYEKFFFAFEKLYEKGLLKMYVGYDSDEPFAMTLFSLINNKAMFLHSGRSDRGNNENLYGIFQLFNSLVELSKNGAKIIDFEGVNSPKNSFSKLKFGGTIHPYYNLILKR